ncbi:TRAM domain-containing protein [Halorubrum sp. C191]|uniref:TRAM domain-containing protein n=1 Tax=Halorubrum sp. C191 TaxID=1383842 RepID=UPI0018EC40DC
MTTSQKLEPAGPPVGPSDRRDVEIESIGEQGDGSAKIDRSYVVIVPDTEVGRRNNGD